MILVEAPQPSDIQCFTNPTDDKFVRWCDI